MRPVARPGLWLAATRPAFLSMTLLAALLGLAFASSRVDQLSGAAMLNAFVALVGALLAHAGANVLNDVADADNGSDASNVDRVAPFTGGSRFIQDGLLSREQMIRFSLLLFGFAALCGAVLLFRAGPLLLWFGGSGLLFAIAYSLPPLQLMSRGLGELAVIAAWITITAGTDYVVRQQTDFSAWLAATPFAIQAALILLVNQIPDARADAAAGKRNWVVRTGPASAHRYFLGGLITSYGVLLLCRQQAILPTTSLIALGALPLGLIAYREISRYWHAPQQLAPAIRLTLVQAHLVGLLILSGLIFERLFRTPT